MHIKERRWSRLCFCCVHAKVVSDPVRVVLALGAGLMTQGELLGLLDISSRMGSQTPKPCYRLKLRLLTDVDFLSLPLCAYESACFESLGLQKLFPHVVRFIFILCSSNFLRTRWVDLGSCNLSSVLEICFFKVTLVTMWLVHVLREQFNLFGIMKGCSCMMCCRAHAYLKIVQKCFLYFLVLGLSPEFGVIHPESNLCVTRLL